MDVGVLLHVGLLVEALAAVGAGVRARVGVDQHVRGQGGRPLEPLPTLPALEAPLLRLGRTASVVVAAVAVVVVAAAAAAVVAAVVVVAVAVAAMKIRERG